MIVIGFSLAVALLVWTFTINESNWLFRILVATLALCLPIQSHALEVVGWDGSIVHCGANWLTTIGGFEKAKDVHDACTQAGEDHPRYGKDRKKLTVYESKGELKKFPTVRCFFEFKNGPCGLIGVINARCPVGSSYIPEADACFCGWTSKESNGKCVPGADCDEMVRRLKQLKIAQDDPRHGFYRNQTCIAEKSCAARSNLDDKQWLNKVVPAFVNPLLGKSGEWPQKMRDCENLSKAPLGGFICQGLMADYHIEVDLQNALNKNGCGTSKDWKKVGDIITECIQQGNAEDVINKFQKAADYIANQMVQSSRDTIRANCKKLNKS